jgi:NAD(P)-dependent dehydrogenase (short-subunit alcohol dehydrogenase family)
MENIFDLSGKVAAVTGGNGGIGLAYAKGLVKSGCKVAIWARNPEKNLEAINLLKAMGGEVQAFIVDVKDPSSCGKALEDTLATFGKIDVCFANAGGAGRQGMFHKTRSTDWEDIISLNLKGVINTFQPIVKYLIDSKLSGKLIITSSVAGILGTPYASGYASTKAAVLGLTRSLAIELGANNIQVNAILPGFIESEMSINTPEVFKDAVKRRIANGILGKMEDMEGIAVFLASKHSNFMSGQEIVMDGGHSINPL